MIPRTRLDLRCTSSGLWWKSNAPPTSSSSSAPCTLRSVSKTTTRHSPCAARCASVPAQAASLSCSSTRSPGRSEWRVTGCRSWVIRTTSVWSRTRIRPLIRQCGRLVLACPRCWERNRPAATRRSPSVETENARSLNLRWKMIETALVNVAHP
uniref:Uncharacterized protein n=1 Tax=Cacopsylla melanoneura TaxID=428564 RepID=A0A8D8ZWK0_9HEMI